jgi:competence protein ComEC
LRKRSGVDGPLLIALALTGGAALALAPIPTALAAVTIAWLLRKRTSGIVIVIAGLGLLINGARARAAIDDARAVYAKTADFLHPPARCEAEAIVIGSPVVLRRPESKDPSAAGEGDSDGRVDVELRAGFCGDRRIEEPLRARIYGAPVDLARGDEIAILVDLSPVHLFLNEGLRDPLPSIARSGVTASGGLVDAQARSRASSIRAFIDRARAHARRRIEATFHPEAAPLARALVLGETNLDPIDDEAFRASGLSHLLAVSGTHLVIAVAGFAAALRALLVRVGPLAARFEVGRISAAVSVPAAWLYADFAGGGGSALRAAGMLTAGMLAHALGRRPCGRRAFAWSLLGPALLDPLALCDLSFALSAGATAGLLLLNRPLSSAIVRGPKLLQKVLAPIATTLSAMLGCAPIIAMVSPTFPLLGIAANLFAAPVGEIAALPICLAHAVLGWAPSVEQGTALLGSGALLTVRVIARFTADQHATFSIPPPTAWQLAALAVAATAAWLANERRRRAATLMVGAALWLLLELQAIRAGSPRGVLRVSVLDIGQGDSHLIDLPGGGTMLIDGGGFVGSPIDTGARVLLPVLRAKRRSKIDVVVLSHPHPDHFGGLVSTVQGIPVGELWDTGQGEDHGAGPAYASLLAGLRARGIPIRRPADLCGGARIVSGAVVEILSPCPGYHPDASANDNSFVLRISYGERAALLVGDAEHEAEAELIHRDPRTLRADLLKVGHHGSRTSTSPAFLRAVSPALAAISCGVRNRFGHPHPIALAALSSARVPALRTDRGGQILWETDGDRIFVRRPGDP